MNSPCLLRPGSPGTPGPNNRPTRKYAAVATSRDMARKCTNMKTRVIWRVFEKPSAYAKPHASDVRSRKNDRRYVKDGSGLCHVFLVSRVLSVSYVARGRKSS